MFGSTSLEVATGLVFVFLLLGVLVSAAGELVSAVLNARAKTLWKGVSALLEDSATKGAMGRAWAARLYAHPIMRPLLPLPTQGNEEVLGPKGKGPSYIPSRSFAIALLDITGVTNPAVSQWQHQLEALLAGLPADGEAELVRQAVQQVADAIGGALDGQQLKADLEDLAARVTGSGQPNPGRIASIAGQIKGETLGPVKARLIELSKHPDAEGLQAIIQEVPTAGVEAAAVRNGLLALLPRLATGSAALATAKGFAQGISGRFARQALAELESKNKDLHGALVKLLDEAHGDVDKLKDHVETWFNHSMERVKGWYKRETVVVHLIIAAVLTIFMNVDALVVMRHLGADPALRQSLLAEADDYVKKAAATPAPSPAGTPSSRASSEPTLRLSAPAPGASTESPAAPPSETAVPSTSDPAAAVGTKASPTAQTTKDSADQASLDLAKSKFQNVQNQLLNLGLPIGWTLPDPLPKPDASSSGAPGAQAASGAATPPVTAGRPAASTPTPRATVAQAGTAASPITTGQPANQAPDEYRRLPRWSQLLSATPEGREERGHLGLTIRFHAIGWLLSIIAASLGAPFWFDVLKTFMNIRATGHPPDAPAKASKASSKPAA